MKKSTRNRKFCCAPAISVGDACTSHCPPALNKAVKRALLNEIKNFDEKAARKEAVDSANGGNSANAYHSWLEQNGGHEPVEANPDVFQRVMA